MFLKICICLLLLLFVGINSINSQVNPNDIIHIKDISLDKRSPVRIAIDNSDNIYVTDATQNSIVIYDASGNLIDVITSVESPLSIAVNETNQIFVGDGISGEILKVETDGNSSVFYSGCLMPSAMVFGNDGLLYVVDSKRKNVISLDISANVVKTIGEGTLLFPTSIEFDGANNRILVGEHGGIGPNVGGGMMGGGNPLTKVWIFDLDGTEIGELGESGNGNGKFYRIQGLAVGKCGNIYICDPFQASISIFDENGNYITKFGKFGNLQGQQNVPLDIAINSKQQIILTSLNKGSLEVYYINDSLPTSNIINSDTTICAGDQTDILIDFTGTAPWTFTYTINGIDQAPIISSDSSYTLTVSAGGLYEVSALSDANYSGTCFSGSALINVVSVLPSSNISLANISVCSGQVANIPIDFTGTSPWTFTYTIDGVNPKTIRTANNPYIFNTSIDGLYEVIAVSDAGCNGTTITGTADITVKNLPSSSFIGGNSTVEICEGSSTDLSIDLTGTAPWTFTYTINDIPTEVNTSISPYIISATKSGLYQLTELSDANCNGTSFSGSTKLNVNPLSTANLTTNTDVICTSKSANLMTYFTGKAPWSISYTTNGLNPIAIENIYANPFAIPISQEGEYEITALSDANGIGTNYSGSVKISQNSLPTSNISTGNASVCSGQAVNIPIVLTGTAPWTFSYTIDGLNPISITTSNNQYNLNTIVGGLYEVISVSDACDDGTTFTGSANVSVNPLPEVNLGVDTSICEGETITFDAGNFNNYLWNDGSTSQTLITGISGNYTVTVGDVYNCVNSDEIVVTVNSLPVSEFTFSSIEQEVSFTNNSLYSNSYLWDFGDSQTSTEINPVHLYETTGIYSVRLTVFSNLCGDNISIDTINILASSIDNLNHKVQTKIYPNPTSGVVTIEVTNPVQTDMTLEIISLTGQRVFTKIYKPQLSIDKLDLSSYPRGVYTIKMRSENFTKTTKLILYK